MIRLLALDLSTKTGWAVMDVIDGGFNLVKSGTLPKLEKPDHPYPMDYAIWAQNCFDSIFALIKEYKPDELVIEETSKGSKNNYSQKILEFIHYLMAVYISACGIKATYYMTGQWRGICGCKLTLEEKKRNKVVKTSHSEGTKVVKNAEGKRIGKIGKKHVNVRRANEIFDLDLVRKDEDRADALLLAYAHYITYHERKV